MPVVTCIWSNMEPDGTNIQYLICFLSESWLQAVFFPLLSPTVALHMAVGRTQSAWKKTSTQHTYCKFSCTDMHCLICVLTLGSCEHMSDSLASTDKERQCMVEATYTAGNSLSTYKDTDMNFVMNVQFSCIWWFCLSLPVTATLVLEKEI